MAESEAKLSKDALYPLNWSYFTIKGHPLILSVVFTHQIIIDIGGLIVFCSPNENSVSVDFICETFRIRIRSRIETVFIAPTTWGFQMEINRMTNIEIVVGRRWYDSATDITTFTTWERSVNINRY